MQAKLKTIIVVVIAVLFVKSITAVPYGAQSVTVESSERANFSGINEVSVSAQAGNVTQLTINTTIITKNWQGYYGNISGTITLDDANGNTLYDWNAGSGFTPEGEIYASNGSISDWTTVECLNFSSGSNSINRSTLEDFFGIGYTDNDGIDETFSGAGPDILVGVNTLSGCNSTNTYVNDSAQSGNYRFNETLLMENSTSSIIFATQIDQNSQGFDNNTWDFQMIVLENGQDSSTTSYFFYVELA